MASGLDVQTDPVFWWWEEDGASRVVLLTDTLLILSGPLSDTALAELESARRAGTVEAADFGADASRVSVGAIERLRYVPDSHRLEVDLIGAGQFDIEPPRSNAGVALGVFDTLAKRLAPGRTPVDSHTDGATGTEDQALTIVGTMVVLGLVSLGLAVAADQAEPTGPLAGVRTTLNDVFERAGYLPALVLFVLATVVQIHRMRRPDTEDTAATSTPGQRVLELDLSGEPAVEMPAAPEPADPLADIANPIDAWSAPDVEAAPEQSVDGWAPPETTSAWDREQEGSESPGEAEGDDAWSPHGPSSTSAGDGWAAPEPSDGGAWEPPSIEDPVEPLPVSSDGSDIVGDPKADAGGGWFGGAVDDREAVGESHGFDAKTAIAADSSDEASVDSWSSESDEVDGWSTGEVAEVDSWATDETDDGDSWSTDELADVETRSEEAFVPAADAIVSEPDVVEPDPDVTRAEPETAAPEPALVDRLHEPEREAEDASDVEAEFWSQSKTDNAPEPWWEQAEAADAGDHGALPTPPSLDDPELADDANDDLVRAEGFDTEAAVQEIVASNLDASAETPAIDPIEHPQVHWTDDPADPPSDEAPVRDESGPAVQAAPEPSVPAPDSPFAEILDREAPMPAWASAPEPTDQLVDRATMERSVPATLIPETAELD